MSNLSILQQNTLLGLTDEHAQALYLRGCERDEGRAFWCANDWQDSLGAVPHLVNMAASGLEGLARAGEAAEEVAIYLRDRHFHTWFPNR